ncbi:hypothetical protein [Haloarcula sp. 1CSR25-25]|jgi:hypothetical protein|uniref:hypothetical protein n=1 Tax=Haloarcula sp. 1CSR25-25 TaxID=2862545 RepID=UPI002894B280|nr:hypothetical protein [Haloarcula sp. 1CSR25-25]MDT3437498.1 hypothetical protein [Haloarcula sp. 1CSR25-25]
MGKNEQSAEDERPTVRIPKYKRGDEVVAWSEVDSEWWEHVQHAKAVHENIVETYRHEPGVEYIEMGRAEETIGGHATETINILVIDRKTRARLDVPDEVEGIPITVEIGTISDTE